MSDGNVVEEYRTNNTSKITVNDMEIVRESLLFYDESVAIVDIDKNDNYKEIAFTSKTVNDCFEVYLYRYVDGKLYEYCCGSSLREILLDKEGRIINSNDYTYFLNNKIVTGYKTIKDNELCSVNTDYKSSMNKKYVVAEDINVAFGETDNMDLSRKDAVEAIDFGNVFTMKKGEEFILIKANTFLSIYYVELADGRRGILTDYVAA